MKALFRLAILSKGGYDQELCQFLDELLPEAQLEIVREADTRLAEYELRAVAAGGARR